MSYPARVSSDVDPTTARDHGAVPSGHENSVASQAPGDLEPVRSFMSLHDHIPGNPVSLPPSPRSLEIWLRANRAISDDDAVTEADLRWGLRIQQALRTKVFEQAGAARDHDAIEVLNDAARDTGLRICFGCPTEGHMHTDAPGMKGAVGRLLGAAFLAELDGTFGRLRGCANPDCTSVFYDRSKNRTARWCSMASCGNRSKVRRFRERERSARASRTDLAERSTRTETPEPRP
jgi:hypothetical protein